MVSGMRKAAVAAAAAVAVAITGFASAGTASADAGTIVVTDRGVVQGAISGGNRTFLGIPYAAPPTGNLRWRPPAPAAPWFGIRNATTPGNKCAQVEFLFGGALKGVEDCLNLNVYEPANASPASRLPVMIFIHGGGYVFGSNTDIDPSTLARTQNMVVVTINYRLGAFGYLAVPGLTAENRDSSGNFGLLDQQAGMRWVQRNITQFGGDITRTTVAGESAGGAAVLANVISPTAAGLFQKAVVESGAGVGFTTLPKAEAQGTMFAGNVGCADPANQVACLRGVDTTTILNNELVGAPPLLLPSAMAWSPTVGGNILPKAPADAFASGNYSKVPLLQGTNHDEWRLFAAGMINAGKALTPESYVGLTYQLFGPRAPEVLANCPAAAYSSPTAAYSAYVSDLGFICSARTVDRAVSKDAATYAYEFNDTNAPPPPPLIIPGFPLGAYHTAELLYVFQRPGAPGLNPAQVALSNQIMTYWGNFAKRSNPNGSGLPTWQPYTNSSDRFLSLAPGDTKMIDTFAADHKCSFWATFGS